MWFPCVHHILELVVGAVVHQRWPTSGPVDAIYIRFKDKWPEIRAKMPEILEKGVHKVLIAYMRLSHFVGLSMGHAV